MIPRIQTILLIVSYAKLLSIMIRCCFIHLVYIRMVADQRLLGLREASLLPPLPLGLSRETMSRTSSKVLSMFYSPSKFLFSTLPPMSWLSAQPPLVTPAPAAPLQSSPLTTWSLLLLINFAKFFRYFVGKRNQSIVTFAIMHVTGCQLGSRRVRFATFARKVDLSCIAKVLFPKS